MILCFGTTPAVQRVMVFSSLSLNAVNRAVRTVESVAGKSLNVAKVLQQIGEFPVALTVLGGDRGAFLRQIMESKGLEMEAVEIASRTRQCVTLLDESAGTQTELVEESSPVSTAEVERLVEIATRRMQPARCLVMSGTIAPGAPVGLYGRLTRLASDFGAISVVDAQGEALTEALKAEPGLVKPNVQELEATVGRRLSGVSELMEAMRELTHRGAKRVVVTAGKGAVLAFDGVYSWKIEPPSVKVVNPIGSGDAFTAGLVRSLVRGDDLGEACRWGAAAGTANALTLLAGEVERADVDRLAREVRVETV